MMCYFPGNPINISISIILEFAVKQSQSYFKLFFPFLDDASAKVNDFFCACDS